MKIILETERLYLREFLTEDAIHLYHMNNDPEVIKYTGNPPFTSEATARNFINNYIAVVYADRGGGTTTGLGRFAVIRKEDDEFLGWCGLKYHPNERVVDLGYRFYRCYWGQGYATESAVSCVEYAFAKAKYPFLVAHAHVQNIASHKVLDRCGMQRQKEINYDSQPAYLYRLDNPEYHIREMSATETWPVRHPVLRAGHPLEDVYMEADEKETTFHVGVFYKKNIVGVASFMEDSHTEFKGIQSRLRGMAVLPDYRRRGVAELLLKEGERLLIERGRTLLWFNARIVALNFYKTLGYEIIGGEFDIPLIGAHYRMKKNL